MTPEQLALLRAAAEKATPGPWAWWTSNSTRRLSSEPSGKDGDVAWGETFGDIAISEKDMAHIAAANPATILALLDHIDQVRASTIEECAKVSRLTQLGKGGPERKAIEDCIHEIRALALPAAPNEEKS